MKIISPRVWEKHLNEVSNTRTLTVRQYIFLKRYEITDSEIIKVLDVPKSTFDNWRNENGLRGVGKKSELRLRAIERERGDDMFIAKESNRLRKRRTYTDEEKRRVLSMKEGRTFKELAEMTGISSKTISQWARNMRGDVS